MKQRFSDSQIISFLQQAQSGIKVEALSREHGFAKATFYNGKPSMAVWILET